MKTTAALRIPMGPDLIQRLEELNPGHNFKKLEQSAISHVLRKAGFEAAIRAPIRKRRAGFNIQLVTTKFVMLVEYADPTGVTGIEGRRTHMPLYEKALTAAGYLVGDFKGYWMVVKQGSATTTASAQEYSVHYLLNKDNDVLGYARFHKMPSGEDGWRFYPNMSSHQRSSKNWPTAWDSVPPRFKKQGQLFSTQEAAQRGVNTYASLQVQGMIPKSTTYALTKNGKVTDQGSAAGMRKLLKKKMKEEPNVSWHVWNSPGNKIGQKISGAVTAATGSRGGNIIGKTSSGKPIYEKHDHPGHSNFTPRDHLDASKVQMEKATKFTREHKRKAAMYHSGHAIEHRKSMMMSHDHRTHNWSGDSKSSLVEGMKADWQKKHRTGSGKYIGTNTDRSFRGWSPQDHQDAATHHKTQHVFWSKAAREHGRSSDMHYEAQHKKAHNFHQSKAVASTESIMLNKKLAHAGLTIQGNLVVADYMQAQKNHFEQGTDDNLTNYPEKGKDRSDLKNPSKPKSKSGTMVQVNQPTRETLF